jgi:endonuclease-3
MTEATEHKAPSTRTIRRVNELLAERYGQRKPTPRDPLDGLVLIILSQATNDINCDRAFRSLKETFPSWEQVREADVEKIADAIRTGGLANQKAARIKQMLNEIWQESGDLDLSWMHDATADECRTYLQRYKGIGPKTIACVLVFFLDKPAFPVDTHVHRVTRRLGWIRPKASAEEAHSVMEALVPDECMLDLHVNLISHGRMVCRAEGNGGPKCGECVIKKHCLYGKSLRIKSAAILSEPPNKYHGNDFFVTVQ